MEKHEEQVVEQFSDEVLEKGLAVYLDEDEDLQAYTNRLDALRENGIHKVTFLKQEIVLVKKNNMLSDDEKKGLIDDYSQQLIEAKKIEAENRSEVKSLTKKAVAEVNKKSRSFEEAVVQKANTAIARHKKEYNEKVSRIVAEGQEREAELKRRIAEASSSDVKTELHNDIEAVQHETKSALFDAKNHFKAEVFKCKEAKHQVFVDQVQKNIELRNSKTNVVENFRLGLKDYVYHFTPAQFFLRNGLYIAILVFFVTSFIVAPLSGNGNLLSLSNILTILEQSSVRMFYALGVAGIILLAGTDLSVGRMVAMGAVITGLILHPGENIVTVFGMGPWDFTAIPMLVRVLMSLSLSIILAVLFSLFAGFFSAKLQIHPFISTLATQLIIYGLLFFGTSGTPVGSIDGSIKDLLGGRWILGVANGSLVTFPKLIIPAVIAIIVAWFIWNKTAFGKKMYAVGGNPEAAAVSGINVFWVTMGVFALAGVFYGFGAFFEAFKANASAGTGQGYELDAIAACVVGGISFKGGIGKISGAVIGVIIFTGLTYCLTFLGIDTNLQFVFKGLIIIAAVALDSVKYLKKK